MDRRTLLSSAIALPVLGAPARKPNIVWIMADDLGYGDVGCYGQRLIRTPNIDRLASEGTRFTDAYAGCTVCAPSRSVLMTGLHMGHTPVRSNPGGVPLPASSVTVATVLKQAGYATGCFGKWGLGDIGTEGVPWRHGFDEFFGYLHQAHAHLHYPRFLYRNGDEHPLEGNASRGRRTYANDVIAAQALSFIRNHRARPFFAYLPLTVPHMELAAPEDSMASYRGRWPEGKPYGDSRQRFPEQTEPRAAYAGMVDRLDRYVGQVTSLLKELNLEKDTLLVFTSDNGGATPLFGDTFFQSCGPFRGHKQNCYEGGLRVPMIARWPGQIRAGKTSSFAWSFADFLPTAAEVAGASAPEGLDGVSVLPTLRGRPQQPHEFLYWELPRYDGKTGTFRREAPMQAIRMGNWKAIRPKADGELELYDLQRDLGETRNLAASEPGVLGRLRDRLSAVRTEPPAQTEPPHPWWTTVG